MDLYVQKVQSQLELDHVRNYVQESEMEELKNELALLKKEKQVLDNKHLVTLFLIQLIEKNVI